MGVTPAGIDTAATFTPVGNASQLPGAFQTLLTAPVHVDRGR